MSTFLPLIKMSPLSLLSIPNIKFIISVLLEPTRPARPTTSPL